MYFKVYQQINEFLLIGIFDDYEESHREFNRTKLSSPSFRIYNKIQFEKYDDNDEEYDYFNIELNDNNKIKNEISEAQMYDPDEVEIEKWVPSRKAKKYLVITS